MGAPHDPNNLKHFYTQLDSGSYGSTLSQCWGEVQKKQNLFNWKQNTKIIKSFK